MLKLAIYSIRGPNDTESRTHWHFLPGVDSDDDDEIQEILENNQNRKMFETDIVRVLDQRGRILAEG